MRRVLAIAAVLGVAATLAVLGTGAGSGGGGYKVRAIFRNAFSLVPGEDVKIAGVKVGKIDGLDVTRDQLAAVDFTITKPGFEDLRADAECTIRPQSLIGEKFIECTPTQPHAPDQRPAPELKVIPDGRPGAGRHLLPVQNTSRPVDIDLVNDIMRLPYRQRLGIIINEFGTGLAARGQDLRSAIRNADPALKATDKLLALLSSQDRVLADLAKQSDIALAPLARERAHVQGFVQHAADVATATAQRRAALKAQLDKLPEFLRQLRPTMTRLGQFSDQATPVLAALRPEAPAINRMIRALGPFSQAGIPALKTLGEATIPGTKALVAARPIVSDLQAFAKSAKPLAAGLAAITTSLHDTGGIERLLDYIFYQVAAINGFDSYGHYLRASLILNLCSQYATTSDPACLAKFQSGASARAASRMTAEQALHAPGESLEWRRTAAVLRGMSAAQAIAETRGESAGAGGAAEAQSGDGAAAHSGARASAPATRPPASGSEQQQAASSVLAGSGAEVQPSGGPASPSSPTGKLLDYLLGGGA